MNDLQQEDIWHRGLITSHLIPPAETLMGSRGWSWAFAIKKKPAIKRAFF